MDILFNKPIKELAKELRAKKISVEELVSESLARIKKTDDKYRSFITVRTKEELKKDIDAAQKRIDSGDATELTGIPYSVKDIYNTKGMRTTASSKILDNYISPYNATVIEKMNKTGAIIVGKTNMDAFAHGGSTETSDYFVSRNPWDITRVTGGSSGGSASSVAGLQVPFSIGTETAGSIRQPSSLCGITGLKGTYGRVSRYGVIAMGSSLDCPGPMTRFVEDATLIMKYISGEDPKDGTSIKEKPLQIDLQDSKEFLKKCKIGISSEYLSICEKGVTKAVEEAIKVLQKSGATIKEVKLLDPEYAIAVYTIICRSEISSNLARYHGTRYGSYSEEKPDSVYDFFKNNRAIFGFEAKKRMMTGAYTLSKGYYDKYYKKAMQVRTLIINNFKEAFQEVDAFITPTSPNVAPIVGESHKNPLHGEMTDRLIAGSTMAGLPGISIPVGFSEGLPVGMQVISPQFKEETICKIAHTYQLETDWHKLTPKDI